MKKEVKEILKEAGQIDLYSDEKFEFVKQFMNSLSKSDKPLKNLLSLDPYYKAKFIADHIMTLRPKI